MELFERVRKVASDIAGSQSNLATLFGLSQSTFQGYLKMERQNNLWPLLPKILDKYPDLSRDWLYFGDGPMLRSEIKPARPAPKPIPVVGLAACGVKGWNCVMPITMSAVLPISDSMIAVIAAGESMVPAGIGPGHICYCDPDQQPLAGDAAYILRRDGLATIKIYLGESKTGPNYIGFKGWLRNGDEYTDDILESQIETLAPVVFVRRRI